jgi:hypothetical protein
VVNERHDERYGGFWRRVLAFIVDGLILGAVMLPFGIGFGLAHMAAILNSEEVNSDTIMSMIAASLLAWFVRVIASWLYGAGFESSRFQATPGKMMVGVRVTDLNGKRITRPRHRTPVRQVGLGADPGHRVPAGGVQRSQAGPARPDRQHPGPRGPTAGHPESVMRR